MATVTGTVEQVTPVAAVPGAPAGTTAATVDIRRASGTKKTLTISFGPGDGPAKKAAKNVMLDVLGKARDSGWPVTVNHATGSGNVNTVTLGGSNIMPIGPAIQGDLYAVTGKGIPATKKVELVLTGEVGGEEITVTVPLRLVRPEWVVADELPTLADNDVPKGRYTLQLKVPSGWKSDPIPVDLDDGPPRTIRTLNVGAAKEDPYVVAFVANPANLDGGGVLQRDPGLNDPARFRMVVNHCLQTLLSRPENVVGQFDPKIRVVVVADPVGPSDKNALLRDHPALAGVLEPRREKIKPFLADRGIEADVAFVLHGSPDHDRGYAWATTDDMTRGTKKFIYEDKDGFHGAYPKVPGSIALPMRFTDDQMALHEFCHAAAEVANGLVIDLYGDDDLPGRGIAVGPRVNKRWRDAPAEGEPVPAVPTNFVKYATVTYKSAKKRSGSQPYPNDWLSYHAAPKVKSRANLMDEYGEDAEPTKCRLDKLTYAWLRDRLKFKMAR